MDAESGGERLPRAQYNLYITLRERGDHTKSLEWLEKASDNEYPGAMYALGDEYLDGEGVPKDVQRAVELFTKAAEQTEDMHAALDSMMILGTLIYDAETDFGLEESVGWLEKAAAEAERGLQEATRAR